MEDIKPRHGGGTDQLQPGEDKYRFLLENSKDILWTIDLTGTWQFITKNVEKIIHIKSEDILGKKAWDFVTPESRAILMDKLQRRLKGEDIQPYEVVVIDGYGRRLPFEVNTSPIFSKDGKIIGIQGISRDVTERKRAEDAVRKSEEKFRRLVENIYDWVWEIDSNAIFTYSSPRVLVLLAYVPPEVVGRSLYDFMEPAEARRMREILPGLIRQGKPFAAVEYTLISRQGKPVGIEMSGNPVFSEDGTLRGYQGICRDISDRKKAEDALRKAYEELEKRVEERTAELANARSTLQAILNTAPIGIIVFDARSRNISFSSPGAEKIFGGPVTGLPYRLVPFRLFRPDGSQYQEEELPLYRSLKYGDLVQDAELVIERADGGRRTILESSAPIHDQRGAITAVVATIVDITERKLTENELREAKSQAELYLDLMSHDINNMNMVAIGNIELAEQAVGENKDAVGLLSRSLEMLQSSTQLIENVRKIQRAEIGGLETSRVNLCEILEDVKRKYSEIPGKEVTIDIAYRGKDHCLVMANKLLEDVFANLISNAIKHATPGRPVVIDIALSKERVDDKDYFRISLEDHGPGIPDDLKGKLFTRLQRGPTKAAGRGLGLYLVKTLVGDFGGKIWAEDRVRGNPREGVRFVVLLPAA